MLNLNNINMNFAAVDNPFLPWEPCWYPSTLTQQEWQEAFDWFVQKNIRDRHLYILNTEKGASNGNKLYSQNLDTRPY